MPPNAGSWASPGTLEAGPDAVSFDWRTRATFLAFERPFVRDCMLMAVVNQDVEHLCRRPTVILKVYRFAGIDLGAM